jgi:hypothetical protein
MDIAKIENESYETYYLRKRFIEFALSIPDTYITKISLPAAILYSHMYAKKIQYGVKYDEPIEKMLNFISSVMG